MNASRHNFSHGDHEEHRGRIESLRDYLRSITKK